jgi:glycosyltransferase involved in cell wall biosynthesis
MQVSIVIPLLNEEDTSWELITKLSEENPSVKGIQFSRNFGKSQALHAGFKAAKGDVIITMDADLQDNPEEIPELYELIYTEGYDLISGWKKKRFDSILFKNLPSKLFNWAARKTSGVKLHDFNCGLKDHRSVGRDAPLHSCSSKKCWFF